MLRFSAVHFCMVSWLVPGCLDKMLSTWDNYKLVPVNLGV